MPSEYEAEYQLYSEACNFGFELQNDRTISIYLSDDLKPYPVHEVTLKQAGPQLLKQVTETCEHPSHKGRSLHFPDDDETAWHYVLFYLFHYRLPVLEIAVRGGSKVENERLNTWVQAWCLGHKYEIPKLQNALMERLLKKIEEDETIPTVAIEHAIRKLPSDCGMYKLMMEELVYEVRQYSKYDELKHFQGIPGFLSKFAEVMEEYEKYPEKYRHSRRLSDDDGPRYTNDEYLEFVEEKEPYTYMY